MIRRTWFLPLLVLFVAPAAAQTPTDSVKPPEITVTTPPPVAGPSAPSLHASPSTGLAPAMASPAMATPAASAGAPVPGPRGAPVAVQAEAAPQGSWMTQLLPFVVIIAIFYLLLIRPQQKKAKEHQSMLSALQKGDQVMTSGGVFGKVIGVADQVVTIEISDRVRIKVARSYVAGKANPEAGKVPEAPQR